MLRDIVTGSHVQTTRAETHLIDVLDDAITDAAGRSHASGLPRGSTDVWVMRDVREDGGMADPTPQTQRNALVPAFLAAIALFLSPLFTADTVTTVILFVVSIFALIVAWFALQARQWWWTVVFVAVAIIWNPVYPFSFDGWVWTLAQFVAALAFIAAGILVKNERTTP